MKIDIEQARKQAKELVRSGQAETLTDAQRVIARELGYESWPKLVHAVVGWNRMSTCDFCGLPKGEREIWRVGDVRSVDPDQDPDLLFVHVDCFMAMTNNPRLTAIGVAAEEAEVDKLTPRAKRLWVGAATVAREFGHDFVGTEHLLLAMVRQPEGVAARMLDDLVGRGEVEKELAAILGSEEYNTRPGEANE